MKALEPLFYAVIGAIMLSVSVLSDNSTVDCGRHAMSPNEQCTTTRFWGPSASPSTLNYEQQRERNQREKIMVGVVGGAMLLAAGTMLYRRYASEKRGAYAGQDDRRLLMAFIGPYLWFFLGLLLVLAILYIGSVSGGILMIIGTAIIINRVRSRGISQSFFKQEGSRRTCDSARRARGGPGFWELAKAFDARETPSRPPNMSATNKKHARDDIEVEFKNVFFNKTHADRERIIAYWLRTGAVSRAAAMKSAISDWRNEQFRF